MPTPSLPTGVSERHQFDRLPAVQTDLYSEANMSVDGRVLSEALLT